jgi:hypothetical protein
VDLALELTVLVVPDVSALGIARARVVTTYGFSRAGVTLELIESGSRRP